MKTVVWPTAEAEDREGGIGAAVQALAAGEVVALPTETVYGLAGDATDPLAVARIFEAKDRPAFDPLIVHIGSWSELERVAQVPAADRALLARLQERYWPGPLTLLLPKTGVIPDLVTAGSPLVAVRMPAHPLFRTVLQRFGRPLAAPSANLFGRISPTTAEHVRASLGGRIPLILDGGPCQWGIESTILQIAGGQLRVLRDGPIPREELAGFAEVAEGRSAAVPGQLESHYAPGKPLILVQNAAFVPTAARATAGMLAWRVAPADFAVAEILSPSGDLREAAARLFGCLHRLDAADIGTIYVEEVPVEGLGRAIMDRLQRAAR